MIIVSGYGLLSLATGGQFDMLVFMLILEGQEAGGMTWSHWHTRLFFFCVVGFLGRDIRSFQPFYVCVFEMLQEGVLYFVFVLMGIHITGGEQGLPCVQEEDGNVSRNVMLFLSPTFPAFRGLCCELKV